MTEGLYRFFSPKDWSLLRDDTPLLLSYEEIKTLESLNAPVSPDQVTSIYLPVARLLTSYLTAKHTLHQATGVFLGTNSRKTPFVIGIAGSVAAGKSTVARLLKALLEKCPTSPQVELVPTDGFLYPNALLETKGIMHRKGFPESYDVGALIQFLFEIKAGTGAVHAPVYSHLKYDIIPNTFICVERPDILILEGLNVLQLPQRSGKPVHGKKDLPALLVSDFFDFSIYLDADENDLRTWYCQRFMTLRETAFQNPDSYFHRYADLLPPCAQETAQLLWETINLINLYENILPTRWRADMILRKNAFHEIETVALRKL